MLTYINDLQKQVGKVLDGVGYSFDLMLLKFGDTFTVLKGGAKYENDYYIEEWREFDYTEFNQADCLKLGVYSKEELDQWNMKRDEKRKNESDSWERQEYLKLKAKFEGKL